MASARILLICSLLAALAACRTEAPRQSLKDHAAPASAVRAPAAVAAPAAAPPAVSAPAPLPAHTPAAAVTESDQPKDQLHAQCWDRYREYLVGDKPRSFEEKLSADSACRLIVCPTCPR